MADDKDTVEEVKKNHGAKVPGGPLVSVLLLLNALLMGAVAYFQWNAHQIEKSKTDIQDVIKAELAHAKEQEKEMESAPDDTPKKGKTFRLDPFTTNLAQTDGPKRFVRMDAVLFVTENSQDDELKNRTFQIRDAIISLLNAKRPDDLLRVDGKNTLKNEIKASLNSFLVDGEILDVYYTSFQVN